MKKYLFLLVISLNSFAYNGSLEVRRYFNSHYPEYLDYTGKNINYGVVLKNGWDLWNFQTRSLPDGKFYVGAEGQASTYFSQGGGLFGLELSWNKLDLGLHHRSIHNFDYNGGRYLNQNYVSMTYKWGN